MIHLCSLQFQSTLPRGERLTYTKNFGETLVISIHAPTRGATQLCGYLPLLLLFQSTLPRGERHYNSSIIKCFTYFNPRSHEGSDVMWLLLVQHQNIFQSTLPRGERHYRPNLQKRRKGHFNPRSHEGSDSSPFCER